MNGNLITGAGYFFRGLGMLTEKGIRPFVLVPLLANILLFLSLGSLAWGYIDALVASAEAALPDWLGFLTWILVPLLSVIGAMITGYVSTLLVLLITSPFMALLAEKVEERQTGREVPALEGIPAALMDLPRALFKEIRKFLYYIPMALFVLIISFIPGLNAFSPLLWFLLGAWMMSLQFLDYPMDNHRLPFKAVKEACSDRRLSSLGLGGVVAFVSGIPLLNLVVVPAAVIGATLLWCDELRAQYANTR